MGFMQDQPMETVDIDFGDGQVTVFFRKMSLSEMDLIDKAQERSKVEGIVEKLMVRARTEAGVKMFSKADRPKIVNQFDPDAVLEVVNAMNAFDVGGDSGN